MKRIWLLFLMMSLLLGGCAPVQQGNETQYTATFLTLFDTVTTIKGPAESKEVFSVQAQKIHDELKMYHELFDIYNDYEGITNLKTINDQAGIAPVVVDSVIIRLLKDCKEYYELTGGKVNAAMGSVLHLWHEARDAGIQDPANAKLPDADALKEAAAHTDMGSVVIDETASSVFIKDPETRLDVGAIAKGWATQRVAENAPEGMLISVGGNVCATGPKAADGTPWVIGIMDPDKPDSNRHTVYVSGGCVVTSGDYQRSYTVNGIKYHHIIDPETLMPSAYWRSVSIICKDSALADVLSTALFLLPLEEGKELLSLYDAEGFWIDLAGEEHMTPGFEEIIRT